MKTIITLLLIIRNPIYCIWKISGCWSAAAWAAQSGWASLLQGLPNAIAEACEESRLWDEAELEAENIEEYLRIEKEIEAEEKAWADYEEWAREEEDRYWQELAVQSSW